MTDAATPTIVPVILSGGMGARLWPLSRKNHPKQFLNLATEELSLIQQTAQRVHGRDRFAPIVVVSNQDHRFLVADTMMRIGCTDAKIILEPSARNTAPALAMAAHYIQERYGNVLMLVMPSDHIIQKQDVFMNAVEEASKIAAEGALMTFGIKPNAPETGFGYICMGDTLSGGARKVEAFVEKPDLATAEGYVKDGNYVWNSGIFLFPAGTYLKELAKFEPDMAADCAEVAKSRKEEGEFIHLDKEAFGSIKEESIDYAVMERTEKAGVVPVDCGWNDAGSWDALWQIRDKDENGNALVGKSFNMNTKNCYIACDDGTRVATLGLDNLVIVSTKDCVLVADKSRSQDVKKLVQMVEKTDPDLVKRYRQEYRPWGHYDSIDMGSRHQVKRITVRPHGRLSLQMHYHRAEHWIVVRGTAKVTRDNETHIISENQSIYIPFGTTHRIENPGKIPLEIIEVQSGSYLGEDDIVRFDDNYGRAEKIA